VKNDLIAIINGQWDERDMQHALGLRNACRILVANTAEKTTFELRGRTTLIWTLKKYVTVFRGWIRQA
jgi:hypothetical protein